MAPGYLAASLLTVLLASACAAPNQVPIPSRVEPRGLSDDQVTALYQAADDWYIATGGKIDLTNTAGAALPVSAGAIEKTAIDQAEQTVETGITVSSGSTARIVIDVQAIGDALGAYPDMFRWVFEHELGHALGLRHEPGTLLEPVRLASGACVDADSLAKVCANYGGCNAGAHPTCEAQ